EAIGPGAPLNVFPYNGRGSTFPISSLGARTGDHHCMPGTPLHKRPRDCRVRAAGQQPSVAWAFSLSRLVVARAHAPPFERIDPSSRLPRKSVAAQQAAAAARAGQVNVAEFRN